MPKKEDVDTISEINDYLEELNKNKLNNSQKKRNTSVNKKDLFREIGILDPNGLQPNPLTGEPYANMYYNPNMPIDKHNPTYTFHSKIWSNFPMYSKRMETIKAIYENQVVLIISGTGSGKTVLTPKFALHALNYQGRIAITNPKRLPSKANAIYAAEQLDVKLGKEVGLKYKGSDSAHYSVNDAKLVYCTDGYVLARLRHDPMLSDFDCVIIDEAHERNVNIDLLLLLLKELIKRRPEFKLIIMSATVNEKIFIDYFPKKEFKFAFIDAGSVSYKPIEEYYLDKPINKFDDNGNLIGDAFIDAAVERAVKILKETEEGDILIFFSGKGEAQDGVMKLHRQLEKVNKNLDSKIFADILHAGTPKEAQDLLVNNKKYKENTKFTRKVIFATEVAESSITINGLDYVIDSGLANENIYYGAKNMVSLEKKYIAKANHRQRKGRVGRTRPGFCYNLFTKKEYEEKFPDYPDAPILSDDISNFILLFLSNKEFVTHINYPFTYPDTKSIKTNSKKEIGAGTDLATFLATMIEKPPIDNIKRILERIEAVGGIKIKNNRGEVTDMGRAMAIFDTTPEIGKMLISGYNYHVRDEIINIAAIFHVSELRMDNIFERFSSKSKDEAQKKKEKQQYEKVKKKWASAWGDHFSLLHIYQDFFERRYDTTNRRTGRLLKEKKGNAREWCKENYLNYNRLDRVRDAAKDINRKFGKVIQIYREKHPENKPTHIFIGFEPKISDKKEENILMAIVQGFFVNLIRKVEQRKYINCFPPDKTTAYLAQESLYASIKTQTNYAIYTELKSIFGKKVYGIVSKVPPNMVELLKNSEIGKKFESCFGKMQVIKSPKGKVKSKKSYRR
jgi:pre-mRNA-splicing factor ATP-dependent RNA helicase DHX15/PRP43